jgi:predicted nucleic acid-binding protein
LKYLLDTCTISELVKKKPAKTVVEWINSCDEEMLFLSVLTIGEIQKGIAKVADAIRKRNLQLWLDTELTERFSGRILPVSQEVALTWGLITGEAELQGTIAPAIDGLIAATAVTHNLTVATRNVTDFIATGARTLNPWE